VAAARLFNRLMVERLGHGEYMAQGGDWGSLIVSNLGRLFPNSVRSIHLNMAFVMPFQSARHFLLSLIGCYFPSLVFSQPEHFQHFSILAPLGDLLQESGYMHIQVITGKNLFGRQFSSTLYHF
jgi:pimeloyl-ACP methyl ester carboxylesterase